MFIPKPTYNQYHNISRACRQNNSLLTPKDTDQINEDNNPCGSWTSLMPQSFVQVWLWQIWFIAITRPSLQHST